MPANNMKVYQINDTQYYRHDTQKEANDLAVKDSTLVISSMVVAFSRAHLLNPDELNEKTNPGSGETFKQILDIMNAAGDPAGLFYEGPKQP